jgi:non-specific serine/threonine protein kinase
MTQVVPVATAPPAPPTHLTPLLTPHGHLRLVSVGDAPPLPAALHERLAAAFALGAGHGLLHLGAAEVASALAPGWAWWRDFAVRYVTGLCATPEGGEIAVSVPDAAALDALIADAPPMLGVEYLSPDVLTALWQQLDAALRAELAASKLSLQEFLKARHPAWNLVGRVYFNLAENRKDPDAPFAFLATYTSRLSAHGKAQHLPLSKALAEYSDGKSRSQLLSLLLPVQRAAEHCEWLREMVEASEIYHPLRWTAVEALRFLRDVAKVEAAGIVVRTPGNWQAGRPSRPVVKANIGAKPPSQLGMDALLDFSMEVTLDGEALSAADIRDLLRQVDGLQLIRGRWVEIDHKRLTRLLQRFQAVEQIAATEGLPFAEAMRLLSSASLTDGGDTSDADWSQLNAGPWLADTLRGLRQPEGLAQVSPGAELKATLRPYQQAGVRWLYLLTRLGLGACLADDMGLGKTIQVLALLLVLKRENQNAPAPNLLVAPASLLANWAAEAERFAPSLRLLIAHPSAMPSAGLRALDAQQLGEADLVITSYGTLLRLPALADMHWRVAVADEAQALKNPSAKQTQQVKKLKAQSRIALTGTPVENRLSDLWSLFDFTHPGLLGTGKVFAAFTKQLADKQHFGPLRTLVQPYILRRLKTDKRVISDLPDKTELKAWCHLNPTQAALYQRAVKELKVALEDAEGIGRKGVVLSFLMRFKQICNHPSQWLGDAAWQPGDSGKFARLRELAEVIAAKQEKVLVFTQFRETTAPLAAFLGTIFGRDGLVLHGGTPVAKRRELVKRFQEDELTPFFVLSLKAGGSGLNLTAASHVIHFDRWWNPAVENQATDRAFRIGQQRNVLVHKFICRGTVEDRIDQLIESKQQLVTDVLEGGVELMLTEMNDRELLDLVQLDIHAAQEN